GAGERRSVRRALQLALGVVRETDVDRERAHAEQHDQCKCHQRQDLTMFLASTSHPTPPDIRLAGRESRKRGPARTLVWDGGSVIPSSGGLTTLDLHRTEEDDA